MKVLIVEDEALISQRIERFTKEILSGQLSHLMVKSTLESASHYINQNPIDLLILDLNLNGKDGFQLLQEVVAQSFHTIILSAYIDKAIIAFDYGVLDFVPKPFNKERLTKAFERCIDQNIPPEFPTRYLAIKKRKKLELIKIEDINYIKGAGNHAALILNNGQHHLHDKSLQRIIRILPSYFERWHKSHIVNTKIVKSITPQFEIILHDGTRLPISRTKYKQLKDRIS